MDVTAIEKFTIIDTDHLAHSWFKREIHTGLNGADFELINTPNTAGLYRIVALYFASPGDVVRLS